MDFIRKDGKYFHEDCAPNEGGTTAVADDFDDDEVCAECGSDLIDDDEIDIPAEETA